jgi:hypothetical protein
MAGATEQKKPSHSTTPNSEKSQRLMAQWLIINGKFVCRWIMV